MGSIVFGERMLELEVPVGTVLRLVESRLSEPDGRWMGALVRAVVPGGQVLRSVVRLPADVVLPSPGSVVELVQPWVEVIEGERNSAFVVRAVGLREVASDVAA